MVEHIPPSLHIQKFALDIAHRLSSFPDFLEASEHLLSHNHLFTHAVIEHHGRKLLAIIEVARMTLTRAGLKLHLFTSCSPKQQPFKSAYFKMLVLLREHREEFPVDLLGRVDRLLLPLSTRLVICHNSDPYAQLGIADSMKKLATTTHLKQPPVQALGEQHRHTLSWPTTNIAASMPPPDAFPPKPSLRDEKSRRGSKKRMLLNLGQLSRPVHRQHPLPPPTPDSGLAPSVDSAPSASRVLARTRRHFGIFCTGKPQSQRPWNRTF